MDEIWMRQKYTTEELGSVCVAKLANCSKTTVLRWLRVFGISVTYKRSMDGRLYTNADWMRQKYVEEGLSPSRVAILANCGKTTVSRWLHIHGILSRTLSEANRGRRLSEKTRRKISESHRGIIHSEETCRKMRKNHPDASGEKNHNWKGGKSFEPYCPKFNKYKKEEVRDEHSRTCFICGAEENGRKHCVHHTDYNKMQGCGETKDWNLLPLCLKCHSKTNGNRWHWFGLLYNHWAMDIGINFGMEEMAWNKY